MVTEREKLKRNYKRQTTGFLIKLASQVPAEISLPLIQNLRKNYAASNSRHIDRITLLNTHEG